MTRASTLTTADGRADDRPLLRAPPFPRAAPRGGPTRRITPDTAIVPRIEALAASIAAARVGGSFWSVADANAADRDPWTVMAGTERIAAAPDSELALLAAAAGRPVRCPGTTDVIDRASLLDRLGEVLARFDYACPFTGTAIVVADWIAVLAAWRRQIDRNRTLAAVTGIAAWKRAAMATHLWSDAPPLLAAAVEPLAVEPGKAIGVWPSRTPRSLLRRAARAGVGVERIEDGFLRSAGLGVHLHAPQSIIVDAQGIHYDPRRPSELETLLRTTSFDAALLARAAALRRAIVAGSVTKYGANTGTMAEIPADRRRILVAGQVEDDLSVRLGGAGITSNLALVAQVRNDEPDAFIVFKPHPDVVAGLRKGHVPTRQALRFADAVLADAPIAALLDQVDAVHVLTSLTGFEALLRGREVVVHGLPFYAGWGLTSDRAPPIARRDRRLTLDALVAGALILYPRYRDPGTNLPCPPEILVRRHGEARPAPRLLHRLRDLQGRGTAALRRITDLRA